MHSKYMEHENIRKLENTMINTMSKQKSTNIKNVEREWEEMIVNYKM